MRPDPGDWTASIVRFAAAVLAAAIALNLAAQFLAPALPVLIPVGGGTALGIGAWRWWRHRHQGW